MINKNTNELTEKELETRREYYRKWRERNKDKIKLYQSRYWAKKSELENSNNNK